MEESRSSPSSIPRSNLEIVSSQRITQLSFSTEALGLLAGARFYGGIASILILLVGTMLLGSAFAAFSNALALLLRKQESLIALNVTLVLPLTFLSSTFLPMNLMPLWMQDVTAFDPVNWAVEVGRQTLSSTMEWSLVGAHLAELLAILLACAWLSIVAFRVISALFDNPAAPFHVIIARRRGAHPGWVVCFTRKEGQSHHGYPLSRDRAL
jgi:ABC-2 type transport system permease protein